MFFSELRAVPSPLVFQLFPIYYKYILARGHGPFVIHDYYEKYGPVFRVGWGTVLFVDMAAATAIYGNYQFSKGVMYEGFNFFGDNIISFRVREIHSQRKKLLSPAYTKKNLALVEERLREVGVRGLVDGLKRAIKDGNSINIYHLIRFTLWDMTSDISLGSSLGMLQGRNHHVIEAVASLLKYGIICAMFPFAKRFVPKCLKDLGLLQKTLIQEYITRRERETKGYVGVRNLDRFYEQMKDGNKLSYEQVYAEAHIMLIAGTDTTTNSLSSFIYLMLKHPHIYNKLVKEVSSITPEGEFLTYKEVKDLLYLDAALKEALRLLPVASIPLLRDTPMDGREICGYFIPGNVSQL
ncbi:hypothetical protein DSO57_1000045 [Entomophthora muscae]|uniref:Uncharacterized protein n=1 Tax=Entomophthora muscae TaxID=34485 RepID=A0ACC2SMD1_9FUNG|nr:hypothetical protein DSO57_1000045 [Entomophthora muscae]